MMELVPDSWLSEKLGLSCARLKHDGKIEARVLASLLDGSPGGKGIFAYAKVATTDIASCSALEQAGFRIVDTMITLSKPFAAHGSVHVDGVRFATEEDAMAVEALARDYITCSRFHLDPRIPDHVADEIKAQWAGNFFKGARGDHMVVCEVEGVVQGFLQLIESSQALVIDLISVSRKVRGTGGALGMLQFAENHLDPRPLVRVGTQAANIPSLRFYQKNGFKVESSHYVFHCFKEATP